MKQVCNATEHLFILGAVKKRIDLAQVLVMRKKNFTRVRAPLLKVTTCHPVWMTNCDGILVADA